MRISIKRTGGFAGLTEEVAQIDTKDLDTQNGAKVEQLVQKIEFFDLPATVSGGEIGADMFHYEVKIEKDALEHSVSFDYDDSVETADLRSFIDVLLN